ncbi:MAG: thymidine kinase [Mollicutes bacterium PWAP]|nr:thymidine kinase [Mollicutes bacterium PWAP]
MRRKQNSGFIETIYGPMYSGKSNELVSRIKAYGYAGEKYIAFSPDIDTRNKKNIIISRTGIQNLATKINSKFPEDIFKYISKDIKAVGIDEAQFFNISLIDVVDKLANLGIDVYVAGLNLDFAKRPFETIMKLLPISEFVTSKMAVCFDCGSNAYFSSRINSSPSDNAVLIGTNQYKAHCRKCWNKTNKNLIKGVKSV